MNSKRQIARIIGTGAYLPERVLTNDDLEKTVDTSNEWIVSRTGIIERRIAGPDEHTSDMGTAAARRALKAASLQATDIDLILVVTMSPDYISPATAMLIQHQLGAVQAAAFDIQAACTGYLYGLSVAKAYIESGMYRTILLVAAEKMSAFIDYTDRNTCVLFGDGAAASVIAAEGSGLSVDQVSLGADGSLADLVIIPGGGSRHPATWETVENKLHYFKMVGKEVFKQAVRRMASAVTASLEAMGLHADDISWLVPHQANIRIIEAIAKGVEIPDDKVYLTLQKYGNTSSSSILIALDELLREKSMEDGEHILLVAFGGGLSWGAAVLTKRGKT